MAVAALVISIIAVLVAGWYGRKQAKEAGRSADAAQAAAEASKVAADAAKDLAAIEAVRLRNELEPRWSGRLRRTENSGVAELWLTLDSGSAVAKFELEIMSEDVQFIGSHTTGSPGHPGHVRTYGPTRVGDRIDVELRLGPRAPDPIHLDIRATNNEMEWTVPLHLRRPSPGSRRRGRVVVS